MAGAMAHSTKCHLKMSFKIFLGIPENYKGAFDKSNKVLTMVA